MKNILRPTLIACATLLTACGGNRSQEISTTEQVPVEDNYSYPQSTSTEPSTSTPATTAPASAASQTTRQQTYQDAFNTGKEMGRSDARNGVYDCAAYASAYSDDWIKQAFIQGYELGYSEVGGSSNASVYDYDDGEAMTSRRSTTTMTNIKTQSPSYEETSVNPISSACFGRHLL